MMSAGIPPTNKLGFLDNGFLSRSSLAGEGTKMGAVCSGGAEAANRRPDDDEDPEDEEVSWTIGNLGFTEYALE
jgi:hypothetical protein